MSAEKFPRVLMFVPQYPYPVVGGLEKQSHLLAKALREHGVDVQVLSGKIHPAQPDHELVQGVPVSRVYWPAVKIARFLVAPLTITQRLFALRSTYDVIHLHQHSWVGLMVIVLANLLRKPILTKLPSAGNGGVPGVKSGAFGWLRLAILLKSDAIVAMSRQSYEELLAVGYPLDRVLLTPNGIDLGDPALLIRPRQASQASQSSQTGVCRFAFAGRLVEDKNVDGLLRAFGRVTEDRSVNVTLTIMGDGPLLGRLRQLCSELGLSGSVVFAGQVENVTERLSEMDVFVLPSSIEGNSNAILEAMAARLPIVSTAVGGTPMLVGEQGQDFLYSPGDPATLAALLSRLVENEALRRALGQAMRKRVEGYFDIKLVAVTYAKAYALLHSRDRNRMSSLASPVVLSTL